MHVSETAVDGFDGETVRDLIPRSLVHSLARLTCAAAIFDSPSCQPTTFLSILFALFFTFHTSSFYITSYFLISCNLFLGSVLLGVLCAHPLFLSQELYCRDACP
jgi:hypothetical protein